MNILTTPLTPTYFIVLFNAYIPHAEYHTSKMGWIIVGNDAIETEFSNQKLKYFNHSVIRLNSITESKAAAIFMDAGIDGINTPYINYSNRDIPANNALESLDSFISENWKFNRDVTWVIIPKPNKQLKGKKVVIEFSVGRLDFKPGDSKMDLDVFMTVITRTSKSITFSVRIPKFLYDKCMTNPVIENRPERDYIECDSLQGLHKQMNELVSQAHNLYENEQAAKRAKKVICIHFTSSENTTRDDYNHGYTGQKISTTFNFFIAYKIPGDNFIHRASFFTYKKIQTGQGSTERGIKGIIDAELHGGKYYIGSIPKVVIEWTQEREDFLFTLEDRFRKLSESLNDFLANLDEEKLQKLIDNSHLLKLINTQ